MAERVDHGIRNVDCAFFVGQTRAGKTRSAMSSLYHVSEGGPILIFDGFHTIDIEEEYGSTIYVQKGNEDWAASHAQDELSNGRHVCVRSQVHEGEYPDMLKIMAETRLGLEPDYNLKIFIDEMARFKRGSSNDRIEDAFAGHRHSTTDAKGRLHRRMPWTAYITAQRVVHASRNMCVAIHHVMIGRMTDPRELEDAKRQFGKHDYKNFLPGQFYSVSSEKIVRFRLRNTPGIEVSDGL